MRRSRVWFVAALAVSALGLAACGSANDGGGSLATGSTGSTDTSGSGSAGGSSGLPSTTAPDRVLAQIAQRGKPKVTVPDRPATKLTITDLIKGTGATVQPGATVLAHYVGVGQQSKQEFDSSWSRGQAAQFPLDQVIPGWQQGIPGMKVGGRRELVIPGALGYGAAGNPPSIQPNETLVFVIDLVAVQNP